MGGTFGGWFLLETNTKQGPTLRSDHGFCVALVARCSGAGHIPNDGRGVSAAIARAYLASRGVEVVALPSGRSLAEWPPREPVFLWAAIWRFAGKDPSAGMHSPLAAFLRLMKPWWRTGGGDDSSCVTDALEIVDLWRPAREAWTRSSPIRAKARERGEIAYGGFSAEYRHFVDALAPFGPAAFKKVIEKGGGW